MTRQIGRNVVVDCSFVSKLFVYPPLFSYSKSFKSEAKQHGHTVVDFGYTFYAFMRGSQILLITIASEILDPHHLITKMLNSPSSITNQPN